MKKTEIVLSILAIITFILNLMFIDGGILFTFLSLILISLLYFIFGFALLNKINFRNLFKNESYKDISTLRILFGTLIGILLSTGVLGVLFGLLSWSGAKSIQLSGILCISIAAILVLIEYLIKKSNFYKAVLPRLLIWGILCFSLFQLPETSILEFKYREYPNYIKSIEALRRDPNNPKLIKQEEQARLEMYKKMYKD